MAIIDLPTTRGFQGASFSLGLDVSESTYTGGLTGNRTRRSNLADRLRGTLLLPPVRDAAAAGQREALLMGMKSAGDLLRMGVPHRAVPGGNIGGTLAAAANAAAGARSLQLSGALARPNLLRYSGMEVDANADDLADGWPIYQSGNTGTVGKARVAGNGSTWGQTVFATALGPLISDILGLSYVSVDGIAPGATYTLAADTKDTVLTVSLQINWFTAASALISADQSFFTFSGGAWARRVLTATAPATASKADIYILGRAQSGGPASAAISVDNVQFEQAAAASAYAGLPTLRAGDWLAVGGNLLQVAYGGATGLDDGTITVPLSMPLPRAVTAGAAVAWSAPTGLWELDDDGLQLDYTAPVVQGGIAIPLRQVVL